MPEVNETPKPKAPGYVREPKDVPCGDEQLKAKQDKIRKDKLAKAAAGTNGKK